MTSAQDPGHDGPVERFHATNGRFVGFLSLAVIVVIVGYVVVVEHSVGGLRLATGALFLGVLVWLTQLRPCAWASRDVLRLQNSVRDVDVPLALVDDVHVGRMLSVWVGKDRYDCVGIGVPLRSMGTGRKRGTAVPGWDRLEEYAERATPPVPAQARSYAQFVERRISTLAEEAKGRAESPGRPAPEGPRKVWALPGIVALVVIGVGFATSLLL